MEDKLYRALLRIEEIEVSAGYESKLVEQIQLATFHTIEEALAYRYELSQWYLPQIRGKSEERRPWTSPEALSTED